VCVRVCVCLCVREFIGLYLSIFCVNAYPMYVCESG